MGNSRDGFVLGERVHLQKGMPCARTTYRVRNSMRIVKIGAKSGLVEEVTPWVHNTIVDEGINNFLQLLAGVHNRHLDATNATLGVGNANPLIAFTFKQVGCDVGPAQVAGSEPAPSAALLWEFHDDTTTVRSNLNYAELWYKDPEGGSDEWKVNNFNGGWGSKPSNQFWHWQCYIELYSTNTKFVEAGLFSLLDLIRGQSANHMTQANMWFRPYTAADAPIGSGGINPSAAPTVDLGDNSITFNFLVNTTTFVGTWAKAEVKLGTTYAGAQQLRYGGCKADGTTCGAKGPGETWTYPWELILAPA